MNEQRKKNLVLIMYLATVLVLAVLYFSVPERKDFLEFQQHWWGAFRDFIASFFHT